MTNIILAGTVVFTPRQVDVLKLRVRGYSIPKLAGVLGIAPSTATGYWNVVKDILYIHDMCELIEWAEQNGLIRYDDQLIKDDIGE